jgi:hypothetical protein
MHRISIYRTRLRSFLSRDMFVRNMLLQNILCCAAGVLALTGAGHGQNSRVFRGEISDSQCAMNVHSLTKSHQEMLKSKTMGGTSLTDPIWCTASRGAE